MGYVYSILGKGYRIRLLGTCKKNQEETYKRKYSFQRFYKYIFLLIYVQNILKIYMKKKLTRENNIYKDFTKVIIFFY